MSELPRNEKMNIANDLAINGHLCQVQINYGISSIIDVTAAYVNYLNGKPLSPLMLNVAKTIDCIVEAVKDFMPK